MGGKETEALLEEIKNMPREQLRKEKTGVISRIARGMHGEQEKIKLRTELQKRLIESGAKGPAGKGASLLAELRSTEEEIRKQCDITSATAKKLAESDGKISKLRRGQEQITEDMARAQVLFQKKKKKEHREDILFLGALGVFISICVYVIIDRLIARLHK